MAGVRGWKLVFNGYGVSLWEDEKFWKWIEVMWLQNNLKVFNATQPYA